MGVRKEQVAFLLCLGLFALVFFRDGAAPGTRGSRRASRPELEHRQPPILARALPPASAGADEASWPNRELFAPPRDTRPLPPLELELPPLSRLDVLFPPPEPGPAPRLYRQTLATRLERVEAPGLFDSLESATGPLALPGLDTSLLVLGETLPEGLLESLPPDQARALSEQLGQLSGGDASVQVGVLDPNAEELGLGISTLVDSGIGSRAHREDQEDVLEPYESAAERAERLESYKRLYDWILLEGVHYLFGQIQNRDRYALGFAERASEPIQFLQVDPDSGRERFPGQDPISYDRARVETFGFAGTVSNGIEERYRAYDGEIKPGSYREVLIFAHECVDARLEAPRALLIAEDLFGRLAAIDPDDPEPRLGLARCYEAAFDFERAFRLSRELVERFPHHAEVHVRLALLEARFFLDESAEERLERALATDRTSWRAHWALGRFLGERGRYAEALEHLQNARRYAPADPALVGVRVDIRTDLGAAALRVGLLDEALDAYEDALRADPGHQPAQAGRLGWAVIDALAAARASAPRSADEGLAGSGAEELSGAGLAALVGDGDLLGGGTLLEEETLGFELLLATGLQALVRGDHTLARTRLEDAVDTDPLRASQAWRALSHLAEVTGYPDQALRFAELAHENDPTDVWVNFQRGRLYAARDDVPDARQAFALALEGEVDLEDALAAIGALSFRIGEHEEAGRYLSRALDLSPARAELRALAGFNHLAQGAVVEARAAFERALDDAPALPEAQGGLAWCIYLLGEEEESLVQLANLDEGRRELSDDDPWRVWARAQIERLSDHLEKVAWSDHFERKSLRNGWQTDEGAGPQVGLFGGEVRLEGVFSRPGRARLWREYPASLFVSFEATVVVSGDSAVRTGLFLAREKERNRVPEVLSEVAVARHKDGSLQVSTLRRGDAEPEVQDVWGVPFASDQPVRLRLERRGQSSESVIDVYVDGIPVAEGIQMADLGLSSPLRLGLFAEGETGRRARVSLDDVEVVFRELR